MAQNMGLHPLLNKGGDKRKNRWMLSVLPYIGDSVKMLPPSKASRPGMSFKEYQAEHLNETIYFPGKVEWNTLDVSIYDVKCSDNLIFEWMKKIYDPTPTSNSNRGHYGPALTPSPAGIGSEPYYKITALLTMFSGCGETLETWVYMNAFPIKIDWGDLDMSSSEITMVDITLRYDRAYILQPGVEALGSGAKPPFLKPFKPFNPQQQQTQQNTQQIPQFQQ
jgi:hypothetical protein